MGQLLQTANEISAGNPKEIAKCMIKTQPGAVCGKSASTVLWSGGLRNVIRLLSPLLQMNLTYQFLSLSSGIP